jgi:hypothetical protein
MNLVAVASYITSFNSFFSKSDITLRDIVEPGSGCGKNGSLSILL